MLIFLLIAAFLPVSSEAAVIKPIDISEAFRGGAPQIKLEEMVQECPNFVSYPGYDGVIWLKQHTYQVDTGGSMSVTTVWVILGKNEIEKKWLEWNIPIPKGGDAQIYEASLYDPGNLTLIQEEPPQKIWNEWHVNFRYVPDEFIMVLSYRQTYANNLAIQDMLWLNESLPIWEQTVIAKVEAGRGFEYVTNVENLEPEIINEGNFDIYEWMLVNQTPSMTRSLRTDSRSWLAFGNRQPVSSFIKLLESYGKTPIPVPPSNVETWLKKGDLPSFFNWLQEQETDNSMTGIREAIPEIAPWSMREKAIIASSWINRFNSGSCRLFWRLAVDPSINGFANESIILNPAIEMKRKNDVYFYEIGQPYEPGVTSLSLVGEAIYAPLEGNRLDKRLIPSRGASDNRLSVTWNLNIEDDNTITGSVSLVIRNLWKDFLLSDMDANDILTVVTGRAASGKDVKMNTVKGGVEISAPLKPGKMIIGTSGENAIIPLAFHQPSWLRDLASAIAPYSIKFPMSMETNYKIKLPANVKDVLPPTQVDRDGGKIKYSEKYEYFKRSGRLEATFRLTLSNTKIDPDMEQEIAFALGRLEMQRSIPLKMK
ncbi:MAG: hypothetical protein FWG09_04845 [Synergistaceae bacterium]|nr:hypothetical protein [Synergistaceae bacterium]